MFVKGASDVLCTRVGYMHGVHTRGWILQGRHSGRDSVSNRQPRDCLLKRLFRRRSKKTTQLRVAGLCAWNAPVTGEFPAQMASNAENVSIWWRHHEIKDPDILKVMKHDCDASGAACLTYSDRVTHICVNKLNIIGSDNRLLPGRRQVII